MNFWIIQGLNGLAFGAILFILAAGFSLIFGLMRVANLAHGAFFMLGAYLGLAALDAGWSFWMAMLFSAALVACLGGIVERFVLRRLSGKPLAQVLVTLGIAFVIADGCLWLWSGDPPARAPAGGVRGCRTLRRHRLSEVPAFSSSPRPLHWRSASGC